MNAQFKPGGVAWRVFSEAGQAPEWTASSGSPPDLLAILAGLRATSPSSLEAGQGQIPAGRTETKTLNTVYPAR